MEQTVLLATNMSSVSPIGRCYADMEKAIFAYINSVSDEALKLYGRGDVNDSSVQEMVNCVTARNVNIAYFSMMGKLSLTTVNH